MATQIAIFCRFSDGTFASLVNSAVSENVVTEIQTGGTGLAQVSGVSVGQAFVGKTMTHAVAKVTTEDANTGCFGYAYLLAPDGKIAMLIQGGGDHLGQFPPLCAPVKMTTGMTAQARFDSQADAATQQASLAVYCTDGTAEVLTATAVSDTKTAMINKDGATIGQALSGKTIMKAYATYSSQFGLNEGLAGNSAFYVESSEGQLKAMYPPSKVNAQELSDWQIYPVRINQNDTASVMSDNS